MGIDHLVFMQSFLDEYLCCFQLSTFQLSRRILRLEESGRLQSMGSQRVGYNMSDFNFQLSAPMNNAAVTLGVQISLWESIFISSGCTCWSGIAGFLQIIFNFGTTTICYPEQVHHLTCTRAHQQNLNKKKTRVQRTKWLPQGHMVLVAPRF